MSNKEQDTKQSEAFKRAAKELDQGDEQRLDDVLRKLVKPQPKKERGDAPEKRRPGTRTKTD